MQTNEPIAWRWSASLHASPTSARQQFDAIMAELPCSTCLHGTPFSDLCAGCVQSGEFDPLNVLDFCAGAIEDAIGLEDGLDGEAGSRVLSMIRTAKARAKLPSSPTPSWCCVNCSHTFGEHSTASQTAGPCVKSGCECEGFQRVPSSPTALPPINQCDGCRRGWPLDSTSGNHFNPDKMGGWPDMIGCTKSRYSPSLPASAEQPT